jgi:Ca2+-transporting ATPase
MRIAYLYDPVQQKRLNVTTDVLPVDLLEYAVWASETHPFDAMEKAIHELYTLTTTADKRSHYHQIKEYPLGGTPPMMTHIFSNVDNNEYVIAAKGAPEAILRQSRLDGRELQRYSEEALTFAKQGYRVLAVGKGYTSNEWPASQHDFEFQFMGLLAFEDPPKKNISEVLRSFTDAGIAIKLMTGDYAETAVAIAQTINIPDSTKVITGNEVMNLQDTQLMRTVKEINIFARMYPEAKLKVINALKKNNEVVAMTGDGVNDAPALRAAHIGIAMGHKGSAVAKKASSLVIADDDLAHMVDAIALGRKIYDNLKKAIRYIISIHIPIIMIVSVPVLFSWEFSAIFTPVHVIFLELIMGPTCSIIYENEPAELHTMHRKPYTIKASFLLPSQLSLSVIQGLIIGIVCLVSGYYSMHHGAGETTVTTIVFLVLLFSNIILTIENRSMQQSITKTVAYPNNLMRGIILINILSIIIIMTMPAVREIFKLEEISIAAISACFLIALAGTLWIEVWKYFSRLKRWKVPA